MPNIEAIDDYETQAREFLDRSREYLSAGHLHQASEKGWGAASHMAKAVAGAQGWTYEYHGQFGGVLRKAGNLAENEDARLEIRAASAVANRLHTNFYQRKRDLDPQEIDEDLEQVAGLLQLLSPLTDFARDG